MSNTSLTINLPEVALFDQENLKRIVTAFVKTLAATTQSATPDNVVKSDVKQKLKLNWREMPISQEVMDMTFQHRVDLGTNDYKDMLHQALEEKYL